MSSDARRNVLLKLRRACAEDLLQYPPIPSLRPGEASPALQRQAADAIAKDLVWMFVRQLRCASLSVEEIEELLGES